MKRTPSAFLMLVGLMWLLYPALISFYLGAKSSFPPLIAIVVAGFGPISLLVGATLTFGGWAIRLGRGLVIVGCAVLSIWAVGFLFSPYINGHLTSAIFLLITAALSDFAAWKIVRETDSELIANR